jgi:hypothetical protein
MRIKKIEFWYILLQKEYVPQTPGIQVPGSSIGHFVGLLADS